MSSAPAPAEPRDAADIWAAAALILFGFMLIAVLG
jgi:hypothetical protein